MAAPPACNGGHRTRQPIDDLAPTAYIHLRWQMQPRIDDAEAVRSVRCSSGTLLVKYYAPRGSTSRPAYPRWIYVVRAGAGGFSMGRRAGHSSRRSSLAAADSRTVRTFSADFGLGDVLWAGAGRGCYALKHWQPGFGGGGGRRTSMIRLQAWSSHARSGGRPDTLTRPPVGSRLHRGADFVRMRRGRATTAFARGVRTRLEADFTTIRCLSTAAALVRPG